MAKPRAILKRIEAVRNIAKITNTMQMIATARFKKAFDRAVAARPYTDRLGRLIEELTAAAGDYTHPLLQSAGREARRRARHREQPRSLRRLQLQRGARALARLAPRSLHERERPRSSCTSRARSSSAGSASRASRSASTLTHIDDKVRVRRGRRDRHAAHRRASRRGELDELHVVYTKFLSVGAPAGRAPSRCCRSPPEAAGGRRGAAEGDLGTQTIFSPDPETILADLLPRSVRLHVFQAFLDAAVSEQTARMVAMKVATDNAHDVIVDLTRTYNRSRQAQITTELSEIMGGAAALE